MYFTGSAGSDWDCLRNNDYGVFDIGGCRMKLDKYDKRVLRMMVKTFCSIFALVIILVLIGIPLLVVKIILGVMLVISFLVKRVYWNYLEGLEIKEKVNKII